MTTQPMRRAGLDAQVDAPRLAVLIPCYNEAASVAQTVAAFRAALPQADVFVYDNASTDKTADIAREAGAEVRLEPLKGKGNVVRRMFADVEADVYVLVDGDATYDAASAPSMISKLRDEYLDMVVGAREETSRDAYRRGHRFGNQLLTGLVASIFGQGLNDMLSGYRVMSRRFVKSFPALSQGFEIETELTVHALEIRAPVAEVITPYSERPAGSASKLNTIRDGIRILRMIINLTRDERPLPFFSWLAAIFAASGILLAAPLFAFYLETGLVPRMPTWVLAVSLGMLSALCLAAGLILDTVTRGRREMKRLAYLAVSR
ncbi:MAG: glycosyltransferase family 2 protein [Caulobacterales bacterium]